MAEPKCIFRAGCPTKGACQERGYCGAGADRSRDPPAPDVLVGALQDRVHTDLFGARVGVAVKASIPSKTESLERLAQLLASAWHHGSWKAETVNEREMQAIMERLGFWPYSYRSLESSGETSGDAEDAAITRELTKTLGAQVDKIQHLKNMVMLAYQALGDKRPLTPEQDQMIRDAFAKGTLARCSCGAHEWGPDYHRIIDSNFDSHYAERPCDPPQQVKSTPESQS